jgi:hypothetical protein
VIIEAIQKKKIFDLAQKKIFFSAVAYSANTKISGNKGQYKAPNVTFLGFRAQFLSNLSI